jgi:hypothetical protein
MDKPVKNLFLMCVYSNFQTLLGGENNGDHDKFNDRITLTTDYSVIRKKKQIIQLSSSCTRKFFSVNTKSQCHITKRGIMEAAK